MKTAEQLLAVMRDARRRAIHANTDAFKFRCDTLTGSRRYATYERQCERYDKAENELRKLIGLPERPNND